MGSGVVGLLISAAVGYWVLERASNQKKEIKTVGQVVGAIIILVSLIGAVCKIYCIASGKCYPLGMGVAYPKGAMNCPMMPPSGK